MKNSSVDLLLLVSRPQQQQQHQNTRTYNKIKKYFVVVVEDPIGDLA